MWRENWTKEQWDSFFKEVVTTYPSVTGCPQVFRNCISFGVDKGWQPIVNDILMKLVVLEPNIEIHQIKEKFGDLRIYYGYEPAGADTYKRVEALIDAAEHKASVTCEHCGSTEGVERRGPQWVKTYCQGCHAKRDSGARMWDEH